MEVREETRTGGILRIADRVARLEQGRRPTGSAKMERSRYQRCTWIGERMGGSVVTEVLLYALAFGMIDS